MSVIILIIVIFLGIWIYKGCTKDETSAGNTNQTSSANDVNAQCPEVICKECDVCEECPACETQDCPSCPACAEAKTVIEGAGELASESLVSLDGYDARVINSDDKNFTYWLYNTKDYVLNNVHTKLVITSTNQTIVSDAYSLSSRQNKSLKLPVDLAASSANYEAKLTIYAANNNGITKAVTFKVHDLNPDVEKSKAFWKNTVIGFDQYQISDSKVNITLVNNKNSDLTLNYLKINSTQWLVNQTIASGAQFEFVKDAALCDSGIYSMPVYMNYSSAGLDYEIKEEQLLVGYCK